MFGGANVSKSTFRVGASNIEAAKENLKKLGIPLVAEDVGKNYGRTVIIRSEDGAFVIKSVGKPIKEI